MYNVVEHKIPHSSIVRLCLHNIMISFVCFEDLDCVDLSEANLLNYVMQPLIMLPYRKLLKSLLLLWLLDLLPIMLYVLFILPHYLHWHQKYLPSRQLQQLVCGACPKSTLIISLGL